MKTLLHIFFYCLTFITYFIAFQIALSFALQAEMTHSFLWLEIQHPTVALFSTIPAIGLVFIGSIICAGIFLKDSFRLSASINAILLSVWIILFIVIGIAIQKEPLEYKWTLEENTPRLYPVIMHKFNMTLTDGNEYVVNKRGLITGEQWGKGGFQTGVSNDRLPAMIDLHYLSIIEDQMYHVKGELPIQKMEMLNTESWLDENKQEQCYNGLIIGMAPYGRVQIWARGNGRTTEVCTLQGNIDMAELIHYKTNDYSTNGYEYQKSRLDGDSLVLENWKQKGMPDSLLFDNYQKRFNYHIIPHINMDNAEILCINLSYYNGEQDQLIWERLKKNKYRSQACPSEIVLHWKNAKDYYTTILRFNEKDIFHLFEKCYLDEASQQGDFFIQINSQGNIAEIGLKTSGIEEKLPLKNIQMTKFETPLNK